MIKRKNGFTLVELSIVLVIIGLLIGGILVGQSLIESAKVNSIIKQVSQYQIMIRLYKDMYRAIPGDDQRAAAKWGVVVGACKTTAGTASQTCSGDGDGYIDNDNHGCGAPYCDSNHETLRAWQHLQLAGLLKDGNTYTGYSASNCSGIGLPCYLPKINSPIIKGDNTSIVTLMGQGPHTDSFDGKPGYRLTIILGRPQSQDLPSLLGRWNGNFATPIIAAAIDGKADDGKPHTGNVTSIGETVYNGHPNCVNGPYVASSSYNIDYDDLACAVIFDVENY